MNLKTLGCITVGLLGIGAAQATPVTVSLGLSAENFIEYGLGATGGRANWEVTARFREAALCQTTGSTTNHQT